MCQSIRGLRGCIGFQIDIKVITLGQDPIKNICAKFGVDPCIRSSEEFIERKKLTDGPMDAEQWHKLT